MAHIDRLVGVGGKVEGVLQTAGIAIVCVGYINIPLDSLVA